eukprot:gene13622-biopygen12563
MRIWCPPPNHGLYDPSFFCDKGGLPGNRGGAAHRPHRPLGYRTVARAWRGHGAGVAPAIGHFLDWVARAWRGRGAGMSCDPRGPVTSPRSPAPPAARVRQAARGETEGDRVRGGGWGRFRSAPYRVYECAALSLEERSLR